MTFLSNNNPFFPDLKVVQNENKELKAAMDVLENDTQAKGDTLRTVLQEKSQIENNLKTHVVELADILEKKTRLETQLEEATQNLAVAQYDVEELKNKVASLLSEKNNLELEKKECSARIEELQSKIDGKFRSTDSNIPSLSQTTTTKSFIVY